MTDTNTDSILNRTEKALLGGTLAIGIAVSLIAIATEVNAKPLLLPTNKLSFAATNLTVEDEIIVKDDQKLISDGVWATLDINLTNHNDRPITLSDDMSLGIFLEKDSKWPTLTSAPINKQATATVNDMGELDDMVLEAGETLTFTAVFDWVVEQKPETVLYTTTGHAPELPDEPNLITTHSQDL